VRERLGEPYRTMLGHFRHEVYEWQLVRGETRAHYLHICDTIQTASEYGLATVSAVSRFSHFRDVVVGVWVPLSVALDMINRSMGHDDLYPFVIPDDVLQKLEFVASLAPSQ
jgi:hypothetical protein